MYDLPTSAKSKKKIIKVQDLLIIFFHKKSNCKKYFEKPIEARARAPQNMNMPNKLNPQVLKILITSEELAFSMMSASATVRQHPLRSMVHIPYCS
jgi:hypothetical protein